MSCRSESRFPFAPISSHKESAKSEVSAQCSACKSSRRSGSTDSVCAAVLVSVTGGFLTNSPDRGVGVDVLGWFSGQIRNQMHSGIDGATRDVE